MLCNHWMMRKKGKYYPSGYGTVCVMMGINDDDHRFEVANPLATPAALGVVS